jgi:nucleotide-binding universal stress UspA family protein
MYRRIVVPLDGSALAERALPEAASFARLMGVPLLLVRVVDLSRLDHYGTHALSLDANLLAQLAQRERDVAQSYLDERCQQFAADGLQASAKVCNGLVGQELVELVEPDDLVIMATRGRGSSAQCLLSSTADVLVKHSAAPVLLIKSDAARGGAIHSSLHRVVA